MVLIGLVKDSSEVQKGRKSINGVDSWKGRMMFEEVKEPPKAPTPRFASPQVKAVLANGPGM